MVVSTLGMHGRILVVRTALTLFATPVAVNMTCNCACPLQILRCSCKSRQQNNVICSRAEVLERFQLLLHFEVILRRLQGKLLCVQFLHLCFLRFLCLLCSRRRLCFLCMDSFESVSLSAACAACAVPSAAVKAGCSATSSESLSLLEGSSCSAACCSLSPAICQGSVTTVTKERW